MERVFYHMILRYMKDSTRLPWFSCSFVDTLDL